MATYVETRKIELVELSGRLLDLLQTTDPTTGTPPVDPENPTPVEIANVSDMLDAANGTLGIIGATATDPATTAQEKVDLILQTLGIPAP